MAYKREVFTILEDDSTKEGVKLPARAEGDAVGGNHVPVTLVKDKAGNYQLLKTYDEGDTGAVEATPGFVSVDDSGNLVFVPVKTEGQAIGNAIPGLIAKDPDGNLVYLKVNASGQLTVTPSDAGISKHNAATTVPSGLNSDTDVVSLTLATNKTYRRAHVSCSATFPTLWKLVQINDATTTILAYGISGPGDYSFEYNLEDISFDSGASGTQTLKVVGKQLQGPLTDLYATVSCLESA